MTTLGESKRHFRSSVSLRTLLFHELKNRIHRFGNGIPRVFKRQTCISQLGVLCYISERHIFDHDTYDGDEGLKAVVFNLQHWAATVPRI